MVKIVEDLPTDQNGSVDIDQWAFGLSAHFDAPSCDALRQAALISLEYGGHVQTQIHESCFRQGLKTAQVLLGLQPDLQTLLATILYLPALHGDLKLDTIESAFGEKVCALTKGVLQLNVSDEQHNLDSADSVAGQSQRDNVRRMLLAIVEDVRVVLIKLAEQLIMLRDMPKVKSTFSDDQAKRVRDIYAPLANRLGIGQLKWEMEDLAFRYIESKDYMAIAKLLAERRIDRDAFIKRAVDTIEENLAIQEVPASVTGRAKHIYSIWRKMKRKGLEFQDIYDVRAIRIQVDSISDCYTVLGVIHGLWQYVPKEFDDYIATPKENGYRSLHTAVIGPEGKTLEVQIRTNQMHKEAELGIAAHWLYKEGLKHDSSYHSKLATLRQILDWQEEVDPQSETTEDDSAYAEIFDDRVYVFTPRGDVIDLMRGATPVDFAYHIHSEVGHRCRGAKVNGAMVPLTYTLRSGDQIDILTAKHPKPSRDWLNGHLGYVKSSRGKAKIQAWFRLQDRDKNILEGKEIIEKESKRLGLEKLNLEKASLRLNFKKTDDLLAGLARGDIKLAHVIGETQPRREPGFDLHPDRTQESKPGAQISGIGNMLCNYAKCCKPLPGDPIVGYITTGRGVTIHRQDCRNMFNEDQHREDRRIQVSWGSASAILYPVDIGILAFDRRGLLSDISGVFAKEQVNVSKLTTKTNDDATAVLELTAQIENLATLGKVLSKVLQLPNVLEAYRIREGS